MSVTLENQIRGLLLPKIQELGFHIVDEQTGPGFDNAIVTLRSAGICIRIVRERTQFFVDFAAPTNSHSWFDSALIFRLLGLSDRASFHMSDAESTFDALRRFLVQFYPELTALFSEDSYQTTEQALHDIAVERAKRFDRPA